MKGGMKIPEYVFAIPRGRLSFPKDSTIGRIVAIIEQKPQATITAISTTIGINRSAVQKHLENLKAYGIIRRIGPAKGGHWEMVVTDGG